jgi:arsenate reductase
MTTTSPSLPRRLLAELLGSAFLAAVVIGSGIAAQQLSRHDIGLELFENAAATAAGLYAIILMFGPVSGGHFNPIVSFVDASFGGISRRDALAYLPAQISGCVLGAVAANGSSPRPRSASRPTTAPAARTCSPRRSRRSGCCS